MYPCARPRSEERHRGQGLKYKFSAILPLTDSIGKRLFAVDESIRSVLVVAGRGKVMEWHSRTKKPVPKDFVGGLARTWVGVVGGLVRRLEPFFGRSQFLHIRYDKLHLYGFRYHGGYVVISVRPSHNQERVQGKLAELAERSGD